MVILCCDCMNQQIETPDHQIIKCENCGRDDCLLEIKDKQTFIFEACLKAYEQGGQSAVFDLVNANWPKTKWAICSPCECESPFINSTCLVCGSVTN